MWSTNTIPQASTSTRFVPMPEPVPNRQTNMSGFTHVYKTPIKQPIFVPSNRTPYQFDFNFYFGNLWSSGNIRMPIYPGIPSSAQSNRDGMMMLKNSVEKSGFKFSPPSDVKQYIPNGAHINQFDEQNKGEGTKKNLSEIFNNVRNEVLIPSSQQQQKSRGKSKKLSRKDQETFVPILCPNVSIVPMVSQPIQTIPPISNMRDWTFVGSIQNSAKTSSEGKVTDSINRGAFSRMDIKNSGNLTAIKEELKKNLNDEPKFRSVKTIKKEDKPVNSSSLINMFSSPLDGKKPRKLFECSGSTMNTDSKSNQKKRRFRKNNDQLKMLNDFYEENKQWTKSQIQEISRATGLKENKVYKWLWDQRNKEYKSTKFVVNKNEDNK